MADSALFGPCRFLFKNYYVIQVDYGVRLDQMIVNGQFDYVDPLITASNFPGRETGRRKFPVALFTAHGSMESIEIGTALHIGGYRPATIRELVTLGATYPSLQQNFGIVALGSKLVHPYWGFATCTGLTSHRINSSLWPEGRHLRLFSFEFPWYGRHRFAAVAL